MTGNLVFSWSENLVVSFKGMILSLVNGNWKSILLVFVVFSATCEKSPLESRTTLWGRYWVSVYLCTFGLRRRLTNWSCRIFLCIYVWKSFSSRYVSVECFLISGIIKFNYKLKVALCWLTYIYGGKIHIKFTLLKISKCTFKCHLVHQQCVQPSSLSNSRIFSSP